MKISCGTPFVQKNSRLVEFSFKTTRVQKAANEGLVRLAATAVVACARLSERNEPMTSLESWRSDLSTSQNASE